MELKRKLIIIINKKNERNKESQVVCLFDFNVVAIV